MHKLKKCNLCYHLQYMMSNRIEKYVIDQGNIEVFLNGDVLLNGMSWLGWDFEMESWQDSCCSKREASPKLSDQDWEGC